MTIHKTESTPPTTQASDEHQQAPNFSNDEQTTKSELAQLSPKQGGNDQSNILPFYGIQPSTRLQSKSHSTAFAPKQHLFQHQGLGTHSMQKQPMHKKSQSVNYHRANFQTQSPNLLRATSASIPKPQMMHQSRNIATSNTIPPKIGHLGSY